MRMYQVSRRHIIHLRPSLICLAEIIIPDLDEEGGTEADQRGETAIEYPNTGRLMSCVQWPTPLGICLGRFRH